MKRYKIAILWRGDGQARAAATSQNNRYQRIFAELDALGIDAEPAVYNEDMIDEVRAQLTKVDGVLVWVNPLDNGCTREQLDALLRDVASTGPWVSAHPDVILKMGVKKVLYRTKQMSWGTDTQLYLTADEFHDAFPGSLLKQNRGNAGQGVWKVEWIEPPGGRTDLISGLEARRGSMPETLPLETSICGPSSNLLRREEARVHILANVSPKLDGYVAAVVKTPLLRFDDRSST